MTTNERRKSADTSKNTINRQCFCATDYRNGELIQCDEPAEKIIWHSDGRVNYYCEEHAEQAINYLADARITET